MRPFKLILAKYLALSLGLSFAGISTFALPSARANTADNIINGQTDLTQGTTYSGGLPGTTSDVTFTAVAYSPAAFTLNTNGFNLSIGTLDDLSPTALTIQNTTSGSTSTITLNGGTNSTSGAAAGDLLYVATGGNLTIGGGAGTLNLALAANGNFDIAGTATISSVISGGFGFTKIGTGTLTLNGLDTYSGNTIVSAGTLAISGTGTGTAGIPTAGALGTGTVIMNGGTVSATATTTLFNNFIAQAGPSSTVTANAVALTLNGGISGSGTLSLSTSSGSPRYTLGGNNSAYAGAVTFGGGRSGFSTANSGSANAAWTINGGTDNGTSLLPATGTVYFGSLAGGAGVRFGGTGTTTWNIGALNTNSTWTGNLGQTVPASQTVTKVGTGTLTFTTANGYTAGTTINGGTLALNTTGTTVAIATGALSLGGGTLSDIGTSTAAQAFSSTALNIGGSTVSTSAATGHVLALGAITHNAGGVANFTPNSQTAAAAGSITTTSANNASGILGGYATVNGADWAAVTGVTPFTIAAYSGYTTLAITTGGSTTTNYQLATGSGTTTATGNLTLGSLKITDSGSTSSLVLGGNNLTFNGTAGGLLFTGGGSYTISGTGVVGSGTTSEFIANINSGSTLTISSPVVSSAATAGSLTKAGAGTLILTGTSAYTGLTAISGGILNLGSATPIGSGNISFGGGTLQYSASNNTDYSSRIVNSTAPISIDTNGRNVTFGSALAATYTSASNTFTGNVGGLTVGDTAGTGSLTLTAANTYIGTTTLNSGTLNITGSGTLGNTNGFYYNQLTVNGGILDLGTTTQTTGVTNFNGGTVQNGTISGLAYNAANAGSATVSANLTGNAGVGLTKSGVGTLTLSGANTYAGATTLNAGTLQYTGSGSSSGGGAFTLNQNTTFTLNTSGTVAASGILLNRTTTDPIINLTSGTLLLGTGGITTVNTSGSPVINFGGGTLKSNGVTSIAGAITINVLSGGATFDTTGGSITSSSSLVNTAGNNGTLTVQGGNTLAIQDNHLGATTISGNSMLQLNGASTIGGLLTIGSGSTFDINNQSTSSVAGLAGAGTVLNTGASAVRTLVITGAGTNVFTGSINPSTSTEKTNTALQLNMTGGSQTLSGASTYAGGTSLSAGTLILGDKAALGTGTVAFNGVTVSANTDLSGANAIANGFTESATTNTFTGTNNLELSGAFTTASRTLTSNITTGALILSNASINIGVASTTSATLTFDGSGNTLVSGNLLNNVTSPGTSNLTYNGTGLLTLSGANTYTGTTTVSGAGTVKLSGSGTLGATTSTLGAIATGAVLDLNGTNQTVDGFSGTSAGQIQNNSGSGISTLTVGGISNTSTFAGIIADNNGVATGGKVSLVKNGTGTLTLSNSSNTFSGGTSLNAGAITYSANGALGTGAVTLNAANAQTVTLTLGTFTTLANAIQVNGAGTNLVVGASGATGQVNGVNGGITLNSANLTYRQTGNGGLRLQTTGITSTGTGGNITFENNTTSNTNAGIDIRVAVNNTGTLLFGGTGNSVTNTSVLSRINATGGSIGANVTGIVQNSLVNLDFSGTTASASTATFEVDQGQVFLNNTAALRVGNVVSVASGATLDVRSSNTIAGLNNVSGSGGTVTNSNTADTVLTIGGAGTYSFGGVLQDGATNKLGFTKTGAGTQTLTGANTYIGATSITAGRLTVNGSTAAGSAVTVSGAGSLGGSGNVAGTVAINSGGNIAPGNSPGILNTGATSYNSGGTYQWEVNNVNGTKGGDPGYDFNNITGSLTIGSTSGSPFTIDVRGLNLFNMAGGVVNWNPNGFSQFTLATASGGIANYASSSFAVTTSNFTNNNSTGNGAFSVQKSGNNLVLAFNPAAGGTGPNGLVQGLGIFASDNASQSAYTGGNLNGQNGGFGYGSWSTSPSTNDSFHGQFIGDARANAAGGSGGTSGTNYSGNFINTTGAKSFGFYANSNNTSEGTRTFTGGLTTGRTFAFDFDNGYADGTSAQGFTLKNGSGTTAFEFYYTSNDGKYHITDSTGQTLTQSFTGDGFHTEFTKTGTNSYTFTISGPGVATQTFSGTLANSATDIGSFRPFNFNQFGVDTASDYNAFYNSPIVELPTFNGQSVGVGGGNFSNGALWAAHAPVNGGSIAFDGTGSIVNNDILTTVYNVAFNATVTNAGGGTGNNTTNAGPYTLTGNALTINAGVDNNSTSLQTINNNLTLGANQTFNATNGGLTFGGTLALNGKSPTINAANAVTLGGVVSGNGDIYKTGAGTLTLAAANTFTGDNTNNRGQIFVTNGSVRAGNSAALGTQTGGVSVDLGDSVTGGVTTHFNNDVSLLANSGLTIPNQIYVDTNTGGSTRTIGSDGTTAATTFSGDVLLTGSAILTAATGGDTTFSGTLGTSGFTAGGVTKASAGTVILTGNNGYAGGTTVNAGTLLVNNTSGSGTGTGAVTVNNSGTVLGGTGTISGAVNVNAGAAITAGTRGSGNTIVAGNVGTFSTGALTLVSSAIFHADISGASTYDVVNVTGAVALGNSTLELNIASGISFSTPLILINNDSTDAIVGTFAGLNQGDAVTANGYTFYANYFGGTGNDFELDFTPVPEPSTWAAGILTVLALGYSQRRRLRRLGAVHRIA